MTMRADTQAITFPVELREAFAFLADPENLPRWAVGFARGIRREGEDWIVQTAQGEMPVRVVADEARGTIDFHMTVAPGVEAVAYSRVIPTTRAPSTSYPVPRPGMADEVFEAQRAALAEELAHPADPLPGAGRLPGWALSDRPAGLAFTTGRASDGTRPRRSSCEELGRAAPRRATGRRWRRSWTACGTASTTSRIRMLWHPADAEDATQEILVRIVTHLGSFRGESAFTTWAIAWPPTTCSRPASAGPNGRS